jgi:hypothetical protein
MLRTPARTRFENPAAQKAATHSRQHEPRQGRHPTGANCVCDDAKVTSPGEAVPAVPVAEAAIGEPRWPPAVALLVYMALNIAIRIWLPSDSPARLSWLVPSIEAALIALLLFGDPSRLARHTQRVRRVAVTIVVALVAAALWATALLIYDLIKGTGVTNSPSELLASGGLVWLGNNLAFALLYWLIDSGGPVARSRNPAPVDFAFTQHMSPELAPPGWRPVFLDYLHLGFTNATAFSPTDVMPLTHRAKYTMVVQSSVALALFGLIVARAVNAFT